MTRVFILATSPVMLAGLSTMLTTVAIRVVGTSSYPEAVIEDVLGVFGFGVADELLLEDLENILFEDHSKAVSLVVLVRNERQSLFMLNKLNLHGWGVITPDISAPQLQEAVLAVAQGFVVLTPAFAKVYSERLPVSETVSMEIPEETLTNREREVLELVSQGLSNKLIARQLQISEHTVKFHISSISTKLGAASRTDAVSRGLRRGLIAL